jgi:hypothetical protein
MMARNPCCSQKEIDEIERRQIGWTLGEGECEDGRNRVRQERQTRTIRIADVGREIDEHLI